MDVVQPTIAEQLVVPMIMVGCTTVLAVIGFLLSYQLSRKDKREDERDARIRHLELQFAAMTGKRPSDTIKMRPQGDTSA